jgi:hypothetical protein
LSVVLRDAVRRLLREVEDRAPIHDRSTLGELRRLVRLEERAGEASEPSTVSAADRRIAALVEALRQFQKPGWHFVGCPGDKRGGVCSAACRLAQAALSSDVIARADDTVDGLMATITALERERHALVLRLRSLERPPGRPRKNPSMQAESVRR